MEAWELSAATKSDFLRFLRDGGGHGPAAASAAEALETIVAAFGVKVRNKGPGIARSLWLLGFGKPVLPVPIKPL